MFRKALCVLAAALVATACVPKVGHGPTPFDPGSPLPYGTKAGSGPRPVDLTPPTAPPTTTAP